MSQQTEYGRLSTLHDYLLYEILQEQRKTNALLEQLLVERMLPKKSPELLQLPPVEKTAVEETPKRRGKQRDK